jgi:hypothetical protein
VRGHFPNDVTRLRIRAAIRTLEHTLWFPGPVHTAGPGPSMEIPLVIGVNPLQTTLFELGIVSGRVVLLLRSAEIQPVFVRFVIEYLRIFSPSYQISISSFPISSLIPLTEIHSREGCSRNSLTHLGGERRGFAKCAAFISPEN